MKSKLDNPPVTITQSTDKLAWMVLWNIGFLMFFSLIVFSGKAKSNVVSYGLLGFLGLGVPVFFYLMVKPMTLLIGPDGIAWRTLWRTRHYAWWQLSEFRCVRANITRSVWFSYRKKQDGFWLPGSFGGLWELGPVELCDMLNAARTKWAVNVSPQV